MKKCICFIAFLISCVMPSSFAAEEITLSTYYPVPYGVYDELQANSLGVGDNDGDGSLDSGDVPTASGDVWIKGSVGIGITNPQAKLTLPDFSSILFQRSDGTDETEINSMTDFGGSILMLKSYRGGTESKILLVTEKVGIGKNAVWNPGHLVELDGGAFCDGTGDWIAGSDRAYKKEIDYDFKYGLNEIKQLKPVHYIHKEDKENKRQIGFIAQDMQLVIPEVVSGDSGALGLSYGQLTAVLVKAIQEQQAVINRLALDIEELKKNQNK